MPEINSDLGSLLDSIERHQAIVNGWDETHRQTVHDLCEAIEQLHKTAFSRLILDLKADPHIHPALRQAVSDEVVYAVLRHLEIIKPSLNERVDAALESVRPFLQSHGGNVELVNIQAPDTVAIRLLGTCEGCPSANFTLVEGVEKAIKERCPEVVTINKVNGLNSSSVTNGVALPLVSPFAKTEDPGWQFALRMEEIPQTGIVVKEFNTHSILFSRQGHKVNCFENACAHMGMSLEMGTIEEGILTCPYHGFQYSLATGECLTAPEVQLIPHPVRVRGMQVEVKLTD